MPCCRSKLDTAQKARVHLLCLNLLTCTVWVDFRQTPFVVAFLGRQLGQRLLQCTKALLNQTSSENRSTHLHLPQECVPFAHVLLCTDNRGYLHVLRHANCRRVLQANATTVYTDRHSVSLVAPPSECSSPPTACTFVALGAAKIAHDVWLHCRPVRGNGRATGSHGDHGELYRIGEPANRDAEGAGSLRAGSARAIHSFARAEPHFRSRGVHHPCASNAWIRRHRGPRTLAR